MRPVFLTFDLATVNDLPNARSAQHRKNLLTSLPKIDIRAVKMFVQALTLATLALGAAAQSSTITSSASLTAGAAETTITGLVVCQMASHAHIDRD